MKFIPHGVARYAVAAAIVFTGLSACCIFRTKNTTQSGAKKPLNPVQRSQSIRCQPCQSFRLKKATPVDKKPVTWTGW
ncbi:hypothetical protein [Rhodoferax antarcticus]|uniref:hypothetical protein n=1 Tax=Rhodoferax antarcticus TaxID=81479 RepID=UPI000A74C4A6|nr:hypothetical protein [Rhodoferax antarcticus]